MVPYGRMPCAVSHRGSCIIQTGARTRACACACQNWVCCRGRLIRGNGLIACAFEFAQSPLFGLNNSRLLGAARTAHRHSRSGLLAHLRFRCQIKSGHFSCISAIFDLPFRATKPVKTLTTPDQNPSREGEVKESTSPPLLLPSQHSRLVPLCVARLLVLPVLPPLFIVLHAPPDFRSCTLTCRARCPGVRMCPEGLQLCLLLADPASLIPVASCQMLETFVCFQ